MGDITRPLPTTPAPASLRAAAEGGGAVVGVDNGWPTDGTPDNAERWQQNVEFSWDACRPLVAGSGQCPTPVDPDADYAKGWDPGGRTSIQFRPFQVEAQMECTLPIIPSPPVPSADIEEAQAQFVAQTSQALTRGLYPQISEELFGGAIARANLDAGNADWEQNRWLTRSDYSDVVPGAGMTVINDEDDPVPLAGAIGLAEAYLSCCSDLPRGVIYAPPALIAPLASKGNMLAPGVTTGGPRFTATGNTLVTDCGITGYGPGDVDEGPQLPPDGVMWIYVTGPLQVRTSIMTPIGTVEEVMAMFAEYNNTVALAPAMATYVWGCCHAAIAVDTSEFGLTLNPGS